MSNLLQLQEIFVESILENNQKISNHFVNPKKGVKAQRLSIYVDAYFLRIIDAIAADFPALFAYLDYDVFAKMIKDYLKFYPSKADSVTFIGAHLSNYLAAEFSSSESDFLAELAALEWNILQVGLLYPEKFFSMADLAIFSIEDLSNYCFQVTDSLRILTTRYNTFAIWSALLEKSVIPEREFFSEPVTYAIWQTDDLQVNYKIVSPQTLRMIQMLVSKKTFAEISSTFVEEEQTQENVINEILQLIQQGFLVK